MSPSPVAPYALAWRLYAVGRRARASCGPTTHRLLIPTMETARATTSGPAPGRIAEEDSMAFSGQVLDNPISGERFIFHQTSDDTAGALLAFDLVVDPNGQVPGGHVHPVQQESFEVLRGTMKFRKGLRTVIAEPGDTVVVPPGAFHQFANAGDEPAVVRVRVAPGLVRAVMAPLAWMAMRRGLDQRYRSLPGLAARRPAPTHPGAGRVAGTRPGPARRGPGLGPQGRPAASA